MTELERILLTAGVTFVAAALGAIVAPFLKARFDRDLEHRKTSLARQAKLYEKQVEIVAQLYASIREIADQIDECARMRTVTQELTEATRQRIEDLLRYHHKQELFLDWSIANAFNNAIVHLSLATTYMSRSIRESLSDEDRSEAWADLRRATIEEIPHYIREAERYSRPLLQPQE